MTRQIADIIRSTPVTPESARADWTGQPLPLHALSGKEAAQAVRQRITKKD